jgi:hypothetical protein
MRLAAASQVGYRAAFGRLSGPLGPVRRRIAQTADHLGKIDRPDRGTGAGFVLGGVVHQ